MSGGPTALCSYLFLPDIPIYLHISVFTEALIQTTTMQDIKKDPAVMLERAQTHDDEPIKPIPAVTKVDYSGAHEKTDPREIALVRKLDKWIMPMLWSMYWLNYLDRNAIALARIDNLEKDLNLTDTGAY